MNYDRYHNILVKKQNGIGVVTINRPDVLNAVSNDLHKELETIWYDVSEDPEINVAILTGAGRAFSAGGNIKTMIERFGTAEHKKHASQIPQGAKQLVAGFLSCPKPIIGAVNGDAMGLGASMALLCDVVVISETAKLGDTHVRIGLVAGDGGAVIWPMLVGVNKAKDFLMRGKVINGKQAVEEGIANYAVPAENVMSEATKIAEELNALPPLAVRWTKVSANLILKQQFNLAFDAAIAFEALTFFSSDHLEACKAFAEKRKGVYKGE